MMYNIWKRIVTGVAWGGAVTFFALTALVIFDVDSSVMTIWLSMGGSLFIGIYFGLAAFIFTVDRWSPLKKTIIHFLLSISVYFLIAFPLGWITFNVGRILFSTIIFMAVYTMFWIGFNLYYRKLTASLNETLNKQRSQH